GQNQPALKNISLEISSGILGVVGRTGSGKSTLCHVLARLYPVRDNSVFLGNNDINNLSITDFRSHIAYVPQDIILFADTIAANISLGNTDATMEAIRKAATIASIHEEIMEMEDGYQSRIGERGVKLSGGQQQRIALARALLLDRPILIIDDGLSAVDMDTEQKIIAALAVYIKDRNCIIVSHRIAPLADAKELLVLDKGRIVAQGTHEELLSSNSFYATIHEYQTSFAPTPPEDSIEAGGPF
ncbi:MAG: ATP-binding cassette domain-containing protein, partial [Desulfobulbaceae bacterium]|nr:ATP-binding cassette domain-containing protein [Desulfobulbaceae bacterium]